MLIRRLEIGGRLSGFFANGTRGIRELAGDQVYMLGVERCRMVVCVYWEVEYDARDALG